MKKTALSGIQTSGNLHIGNYLGSINNWLKLQEEYNCFFFLADLHSITIDRSPEDLRNSILSASATYLACGLDPKKSTIFLQSSVKEHSELAWILNCLTPIGWLKRMTQFKDKSGKNQDNANTGLFTYPVLMAADILLYNADIVPVGEDQKQHIELARDIAGAVNRKMGMEVLKMPEPVIQGLGTRVMSLRDGRQKMSKSDISDASRINLTDSSDLIVQKIKKSKTDSMDFISYDKEERPEVANLINIYASLSGQSIDEIVNAYQTVGFAKFKNDLADIVAESLRPINLEYNRLMQDHGYLLTILQDGAETARFLAKKTCDNLKELLGFVVF